MKNPSKIETPKAVCKTAIVSPGFAGRAGLFPEQNEVLRSEKITRNLDKVAYATLSTRCGQDKRPALFFRLLAELASGHPPYAAFFGLFDCPETRFFVLNGARMP